MIHNVVDESSTLNVGYDALNICRILNSMDFMVTAYNNNLYLSCAKGKLSHEINDTLNEINFGEIVCQFNVSVVKLYYFSLLHVGQYFMQQRRKMTPLEHPWSLN